MNVSQGRLRSGRSEDEINAAWKTLLGVINQLPGTETYNQIMSVVCQGSRDLCRADGVSFVLRDGDHCHYVDEDALSPLWKGRKFPLETCISGWCMINGRTAVIPDIYVDARIPHDAYRPTFVKTLVMVPVPQEDPIAAIGTYWAEPQAPSSHTVMMLEALARSTGSAMRKARELESGRAAG